MLCVGAGNKSVCKPVQMAIIFALTICGLVELRLTSKKLEDPSVQNTSGQLQSKCKIGLNTGTPGASSWRIYGGREAKPGEFPFMVNVFSDEGLHICGGAIIDHRLILSARHCFKDVKKDSLQIYVGDHDQDLEGDGERRVSIHEIILHPTADLALLITGEPLEWTITEQGLGSVDRILLPDMDWSQRHGSNVSVAGWGEAEIGVDSGKLRWVDVSIVDCANGSGEDDDDHEGHLCASADKGKDSCMGDSGGPLFAAAGPTALDGRMQLIGIVSWGPELCGRGESASYVNVYSFLQWIHCGQSIVNNTNSSLANTSNQ